MSILKAILPWWFITAIFLAGLHQYLQWNTSYSPDFLNNYLDPFLAPIIILHLFWIDRQLLYVKDKKPLSELQILIITLMLILFSEVVFPLISENFYVDPYDCIAFFLGGLTYLKLTRQKRVV